jgi:hypothetical protein
MRNVADVIAHEETCGGALGRLSLKREMKSAYWIDGRLLTERACRTSEPSSKASKRHCICSVRVWSWMAQPQRARPRRNEWCPGARVPARE